MSIPPEMLSQLTSVAAGIASNMSADDKKALENMDMASMMGMVSNLMANPQILQMQQQLEGASTISSDKPKKKKKKKNKKKRTKDLNYTLNLTLEELYNGKSKKIALRRKRIQEDGSVAEEKKQFKIPIKKGMRDEQTITLPGEADQLPDHESGDIIITICEEGHDVFEREGDDLMIVKNISLAENFDLEFKVKHLDGSVLHVSKSPSDILHLLDGVRKIQGKGMPVTGGDTYGDLFVRFNIVLPEKQLSSENIEKLKEIFPSEEEEIKEEATERVSLEQISDSDMDQFDDSEYDYDDDSDDENILDEELDDISISDDSDA